VRNFATLSAGTGVFEIVPGERGQGFMAGKRTQAALSR